MSEEQHPEAHHSVRPIILQGDCDAGSEQQRAYPEQRKRKEKINWPTR